MLAGVVACALALAAPAEAQAPIPPESYPETPDGFEVTAREAVRIADRDPNVAAVSADRGRLEIRMEAKPPDKWQVGYFDGDDEVVQVHVHSRSGDVLESWTGDQVAWPMARGYEGQFGHALNAWYVWIPLAALFLLGLFDFRRPFRVAHLDLLVLLSFGLSHLFFNDGEIGVSVPLVYPPLAYLLARMLWIGFRGLGDGGGLRPSAPASFLAVACLFLLAFRVALNIADSGVIDVGYAGVIGAERISEGEAIYGDEAFPEDNPTGDTYGPANYFAYVPFEAALPWSGEWDDLPAAHAAAIFFDLATVAGLFLLGRRLGPGDRRGAQAAGTVLAFAWLAYPYTAFALQSNSNDSLVAALLVWGLVLFGSPVARAGLVAVAALTKFAPLALLPLYAVGERGLADRLEGRRPRWTPLRPVALAAAAAIAVSVILLAHPAIDPGLATFWDRTAESQLDRESPFSIWGQVGGLGWLQALTLAGAAVLAVLVAFVPRRRTLGQVAALAAAVLIASQLAVDHWFYLYLPWFAGLVFVALRGDSPECA
jgi:Glycosyltransferase family 87